MKQSHSIEVIHPTLPRGGLRRMTMANSLTIGAALAALVLSVTLSLAGNPDTCARPFDIGPADTAPHAPCHYR